MSIADLHRDYDNQNRGDRADDIGQSYQSYWRALLMLRLGSTDTFTIHQGEDAIILDKNNKKTYYQIKYRSDPWTAAPIRSLMRDAVNRISTDNTFYVLCTNTDLNRDAREIFQETNNRITYEVLQLKENPRIDIEEEIKKVIQKHYEGKKIEYVLNYYQTQVCANNLINLELELKTKSQETAITFDGNTIWDKIGLKQLIDEIPSCIFGDQILSWSSLVEKAALSESDDFYSSVSKILSDDNDLIKFELESEIIQEVKKWYDKSSESHLSLIHGSSGTGKTWLLLTLGKQLASLYNVYWVDGIPSNKECNLELISSYMGAPIIILMDDMIENDWYISVKRALNNSNVFIIGSTSKEKYNPHVNALCRCFRNKVSFSILRSILDPRSIKELIKIKRKSGVSLREGRILKSSNIRNAIRVLDGKPSIAYYEDKLFYRWRQDEYQPWILAIIFCSKLKVLLPQFLLRKYAQLNLKAFRELPEDISSILLRRNYEDEDVLWFEDPNICDKTLKMIRYEIGFSGYSKLLLELTIKLITQTDIMKPLHRLFIRRLLYGIIYNFPSLQKELLDSCKEKIYQILELETHSDIVNVWLKLLPDIERSIEASRIAKTIYSSNKPPKSMADVSLLVYAYGNKYMRDLIKTNLIGSSQWDVRPWASYIEYLKPLDASTKKELLEIIIPLLDIAPIDLYELFSTRNFAEILLKMVNDHGKPEHRDWLLKLVDHFIYKSQSEIISSYYHLIPPYLQLIDRCFMQHRNFLSINAFNRLTNETNINSASYEDIFYSTYDNYQKRYIIENESTLRSGAIQNCVNIASKLTITYPTQANYLWIKLLKFSEAWALQNEKTMIENGVDQLFDIIITENINPPVSFSETILNYTKNLVNGNDSDFKKLSLLIKILQKSSDENFNISLVFLLSTYTITHGIHTNDLSVEAKNLISKIIFGNNEDFGIYLERLLHKYYTTLSIESMKIILPQNFDPAVQNHNVVKIIFYCIKRITFDEDFISKLCIQIIKIWSSNDYLKNDLLDVLYYLNDFKHADTILKLINELNKENPDTYLRLSIWESRFGDTDKSEKYIRRALEIYSDETKGGHPDLVSLSYKELASKCTNWKSKILNLCSFLVCPGLLKSLEE